MRILFVTKNVPLPLDQGANIRNYFLMKEVSASHEVFLAALARHPRELGYAKDMHCIARRTEAILEERTNAARILDLGRTFCKRVPYVVLANTSPRLRGAIGDIVKFEQIDVVQIEEHYMAENIGLLPCPLVLDAHNIESLILERLATIAPNRVAQVYYRAQARKMREYEQRIAKRAAAVFAVSTVEAEYYSNFNKNCYTVPNGVDAVHIEPLPDTKEVLFTGFLGYPPNADALKFLVTEVWPLVLEQLPEAVLHVVGRNPPQALSANSVKLHGNVDDITPFFRNCSLLAVPLRAGGGTRFKILQAFSYGLPVVSTVLGAEGIEAEDGIHLLLRNGKREFAAAMVDVLTNRGLAEHLRSQAAELAQRRYVWKSVVKTCLEAYEAMTA